MARLQSFTPGRGLPGLFEITPATINGYEAYIRWAEIEVPQHIAPKMEMLVRHMALVNQSHARKMSFGPYDPTGRDSSLAWRTPAQGIRRISQAYYLGWRVKRVGPGWFRLWNASREAYFIEYGISTAGGIGNMGPRHVPKRRIRRPVRKLSLLKTMEFMKTTHAYHRIWVDVFRSRHTHGGFTQHIQSPAGGHARWENATQHEALGVVRRITRHGGISRGNVVGVRKTHGGWEIRRKNRGGGSYTGPALGRRLP